MSNTSSESSNKSDSNKSESSNKSEYSNKSDSINSSISRKSEHIGERNTADAEKVQEALNEFYKMKSKYETIYYEKYVKPIIKSKDKSKREKRVEYSKLPKAECINCKRNVGTVFSIKPDPEDYKRIFIAKCGDLDEPCPLDIQFELADRQRLETQTKEDTNDLNYIKTKIVVDKNDTIFGYTDEQTAIIRFKLNTERMTETTEMLGYTINTNITINDSPEKKELLKHLEVDFGDNLLIPFKNMIKEYEASGYNNNAKMIEAITFYKDEMIPALTEIQKLKYKTDMIEFNENEKSKSDSIYTLLQRKNSLASSEFNFFTDDKFVSFVKGIYETKGKTAKNRSSQNIVTRKNKKQVLVLEEEEEPEVPVVEEEEEEQVEKEKEPDSESKEYYNIWNSLTQKYKDNLSQDPDWLTKTMNSFIEFDKRRTEGKTRYGESREFVHPDSLLLPPKLSEDGSYYDYGNPLYNKILNSSQDSLREGSKKVGPNAILMSMLPKNPDGSYDQYLTALANIIGPEVGFTKQ
jgi:hypothetical protein